MGVRVTVQDFGNQAMTCLAEMHIPRGIEPPSVGPEIGEGVYKPNPVLGGKPPQKLLGIFQRLRVDLQAEPFEDFRAHVVLYLYLARHDKKE